MRRHGQPVSSAFSWAEIVTRLRHHPKKYIYENWKKVPIPVNVNKCLLVWLDQQYLTSFGRTNLPVRGVYSTYNSLKNTVTGKYSKFIFCTVIFNYCLCVLCQAGSVEGWRGLSLHLPSSWEFRQAERFDWKIWLIDLIDRLLENILDSLVRAFDWLIIYYCKMFLRV